MSELFPASDENIKKPEKKVRVLKHNNVWNSEGLLRVRTEKDGEIIICSKTEKELYYINESGSTIMLNSFGSCIVCDKIFHYTQLKFSDDHGKPAWPIEYDGCHCLECNELPLTPEEEKEIAKLMR